MSGRLRIGTRGSRLALWQAEHVRSGLGIPAEIVVMRTAGDAQKDVPLQGLSTTGFFTREIERELLDGNVDLAVHSLKDLPVEQPEGLVIAAVLERHDAGDVLLVRPEAVSPGSFPVRPGARVGAGSLRRRSSLVACRPDLVPALVRGNVPTRVRKVAAGEVDAMIIARAGMARLGLDPSPLAAYDIDPARWIPAPGQASVAVEIRADDSSTAAAVKRLDHAPTRACVEIERRLLAASGGGCHAPFAAWARPGEVGQGGAAAMSLSVGAPGRDGSWRTAHFAGQAAEVEDLAREWIAAGCPETGAPPGMEVDLCSPVRPWS